MFSHFNSFFFIFSNLLVVYISFSTASMAMGGREPWRRLLGSISGIPVLTLIILLILGTIGRISPVPIMVLLSIISMPLSLAHMRHIKKKKKQLNIAEKNLYSDMLLRVSFSLLALLAVIFFYRNCLQGIAFDRDALKYHATAPAQWLIDKRFSLAPVNFHAYYPYNSEIFSLWFMLPFHSDALVNLCGFYWGLLGVAASAGIGLAEELSTSILCASITLAAPVLIISAMRFSATDLAAPASMLAAVALGTASLRNSTQKSTVVDISYSALLAGFSVGCKVSFAPMAAILFLYILLKRREKWLQYAILFIICFSITGIYWYARNFLLTGNPLYPAQIACFKGPFGFEQQYRTSLASWIMANPTNSKLWKYIAMVVLNWPFSLGILAAAGYCFSIYLEFFKKSNTYSVRFLLLLMAFVFIILYPITPFSGTANGYNARFRIPLRFFIFPFYIGITLLSQIGHKKKCLCLVAICVLVTMYPHINTSNIVAFTVGAVVFLMWKKILNIYFILKQMPRLSSSVGLLTILILLTILAPHSHKLNSTKIYSFLYAKKYPLGDTWHALNNIPYGSKVSGFGAGCFLYYPMFGRELQYVPIFPGRVYLYKEWHINGTSRWSNWGKGSRDASDYYIFFGTTKVGTNKFGTNKFATNKKRSRGKWEKGKTRRISNRKFLLKKVFSAGGEYIITNNSSHIRGKTYYKMLDSLKEANVIYSNYFWTIWKVGRNVMPVRNQKE